MGPSPQVHSPLSRKRTRYARRAFTLVEMLVVVLILAILMAVALPLYMAAINESARRTARGNLHTLINAEQTYRLKNDRYTDIVADLIISPTNPRGVIDKDIVGPGKTKYTLYTSGTLPDGTNRSVPEGGVAACAEDETLGAAGDYGCFLPGDDKD
jgi:prepilin-type N-terminal cleavage/methylation domain-containing protein